MIDPGFITCNYLFQMTWVTSYFSITRSSRSRKIVRESHINEIKRVQNEKPLREFTHKYHQKKKTSGQIDEVVKFVQSDVRKINITDNIRFSRYLFLDIYIIRVLVLYPCTDCNSILCTKYWYFKLNPVRFRGHDRSCASKITMPSSGR